MVRTTPPVSAQAVKDTQPSHLEGIATAWPGQLRWTGVDQDNYSGQGQATRSTRRGKGDC